MKPELPMLLLTPDAMAAVDAAAAASGLDSFGLMIKAGEAVAAAALRLYPGARRFVVLCGPGNNGGDGYVAATALASCGATVVLHHLGDAARLTGDAQKAHMRCGLTGHPVEAYQPLQGDVVLDAVFGAGLARDVPSAIADLVERVATAGLPVIAVDLPSGLDGRTGMVRGAAFRATHTVTFMTRKPGHLLLPGRDLCGPIEVYDIGIPARLVEAHAGDITLNHPGVWTDKLPKAASDSHKYRRGHLTVFSGGSAATGAARLSAISGLRVGAGLVTLASPDEAMAANAAQTTAVMVKPVDDLPDLQAYLQDGRRGAFVLGPGFGVGVKARDFALALKDRLLVLDADGITAFKEDPQSLFVAFAGGDTRLVLTPHEGEFARLFPDLAADTSLGKVDKAQAAAARAHAVIVYKGADTVIAAPDGRALINDNAPPWLATAGSGDVLAGMIGGLLAQGVPAFEAAAAGVWLHGEAARQAGEGLTAEDLAAAGKPFSAL
ncbi:NAD(P)H-hydrate dehydratase [Agrobacterium sp. a22-2]|uniref:NAD(P)H-hydrate dehydratase n=1 Tax=Agrobacterium sp. a22-2 TaxID=2283840 RepID=UPI0014489AAB|nr:NAD(P)H-hydrate dehydratase [Agrobacterium sp. a22-2]NKN37687.1 NAD(P)H-hydrate dehydratase [Agrobacterium sp. a22-2]